jgi:hypothetical protein
MPNHATCQPERSTVAVVYVGKIAAERRPGYSV